MRESEGPVKYVWIAPALASLAFFVFSISVVVSEGPFGFISEHTRNGWGLQIGIDLVSCALLALLFAAPLTRRYGIRLWPWVVLTLATGSIGLFALAARLLYARHTRAGAAAEGVLNQIA